MAEKKQPTDSGSNNLTLQNYRATLGTLLGTRTPASRHHAPRSPNSNTSSVRPRSVGRLLRLSHAGQLAAERLLELGDDGVVGDGLAALILIHDLRLHVELLPRQTGGHGSAAVGRSAARNRSCKGAVVRTVASCFCVMPLAVRAFCSASFSSVGTFASARHACRRQNSRPQQAFVTKAGEGAGRAPACKGPGAHARPYPPRVPECGDGAQILWRLGGRAVASAHVSPRQCRCLICSPRRRQRKDRRSCLHRASPWSRSAHPCAARPSGSAASGDCWRRSVAWCQRRRCSSPDPSALHAAA